MGPLLVNNQPQKVGRRERPIGACACGFGFLAQRLCPSPGLSRKRGDEGMAACSVLSLLWDFHITLGWGGNRLGIPHQAGSAHHEVCGWSWSFPAITILVSRILRLLSHPRT